MSGAPITRERLEAEMAAALADAGDAVRAAWEAIRIEPEKWQCSPWGDEIGGFWVVGELAGAVVWYNDFEDGFNTSPFEVRGRIGEYRCDETTFADILAFLPDGLAAEAFAQSGPSAEVPAELHLPGRIERRQTTYWDLLPGEGRWRAHFTGKQELGYTSASYDRVLLLDRHPTLLDYEENWASLYVTDAKGLGQRFLDELSTRVRSASQGWRGEAEYLSLGGGSRVLTAGFGLLLEAPSSVARMAADLVEAFGAVSSLTKGRPARPGFRALIVGRNFVVARAFRFERR